MEETIMKHCSECLQDFTPGAIVHYTWYENRCFCDKCKQTMNTRVTPSYLDWQPRKVAD